MNASSISRGSSRDEHTPAIGRRSRGTNAQSAKTRLEVFWKEKVGKYSVVGTVDVNHLETNEEFRNEIIQNGRIKRNQQKNMNGLNASFVRNSSGSTTLTTN